MAKNITTDLGLPGSYGNGTELEQQPVTTLPAHARRGWALSDDTLGDSYVLEFAAPVGHSARNSVIARCDAAAKAWVPLASAGCVSALPYQSGYLTALPADLDAACGKATVVRFSAASDRFWARLNRDERVAIVAR